MKLTKEQVTEIASSIGVDYPSLMAFISVESGGSGFDPVTGKLIIQFEPTWFHRYLVTFKVPHDYSSSLVDGKTTYTISSGTHKLVNRVEGQKAEWEAFNTAFAIHPQSAMLSTSIGLMQLMGFNYASQGYKTVNEMWDDFKKGEYQQVKGGALFIKNNHNLHNALVSKTWDKVAYYYNGEKYKENNYDNRLAAAYSKYHTA